MRIEDFPRPKDDNGRGVHWSASVYHPSGSDLDFWIGELQAMKIKWVKLLDDGGGSSLELCERLLDADIMPIVRLYREKPNPGHIGGREIETIRRLVAIGVRYFETNNEPDLPAEWSTRMPENWLEIVIDNFIYDADRVLDLGGYLALPAMGPGSKDNPIEMVLRKGRGDLFENGCWVAIHNYTLNHPLDYPDDEVNQLGIPLTQEEYDRFGPWAWDYRSIEEINRLRAERKNPGATVYDDPNCFRGYLWTARMIRETLGFMVPIISTEGGPVVGWGDDKRYPKVIPEQHAEWQVEICRFMQEEAPDYYFTCCTWLLASSALGDPNPTWDQMSWYTHAWDERFGLNGQLPVVQALKELPSVSRLVPEGTAVVTGHVVRDDNDRPLPGFPVILRPIEEATRPRETTSDDEGRYTFDQVAAGTYELEAGHGDASLRLDVPDGETVVADLRVPVGNFSVLRGRMVDTRGTPVGSAPVRLLTLLGEEVAATSTDREGYYQLDGLPAGRFRLEAAEGDQRVRIDGIVLNGFETKTLDITVPAPVGYMYAVVTKRLLPPEETQGRNVFYGRVLDPSGNGINGVLVEMRWVGAEPGTEFPRVRTGHDPFRPPGSYEFVHTPGEFMLQVVQGDWESEVADGLKTTGIPGREGDAITWEVNFQLKPVSSGQASVVRGRVPGGREGTRIFLVEGESGQRWTTTLGPDGRFIFTDLARGAYSLELEGIGLIRDHINLDGLNEVEVIFPMQGVIQGTVRGATSGMQVTLRPLVPGWEWTRQAQVSAQGHYRFTHLPPAPYEIELDPKHKVQAVCDGVGRFTAPAIDLGGAMRSVLRGQVVDAAATPQVGVIVQLFKGDELVGEATTDEEGWFAFGGLVAGTYEVRVPSLDLVRRGVTIDGVSEFEIVLAPEGAPAESVIEGVVLDAEGAPVPDRKVTLYRDVWVGETVTDAQGRYTFGGLPGGVYMISLEGVGVIHRDVVLDGRNQVSLTYQLAAEGVKPLPFYVLFGSSDDPDTRTALLLALPYLMSSRAVAGFSLQEAMSAGHVTIIGGEDAVSAADEQALREAGCVVERLAGDLYEIERALKERLREGE
ncbi:MAG TPA: carboxypeptidase regulatory-like domain-containing protein [Caldilineae bacterium]|nr:carboxypeptidase regulatory-like domain-containing protein [Caldilineae bacterium]